MERNPPQVKKMLAQEGIYLVQHPRTRAYFVVHVNGAGVAEQMKFDGVLRDGLWHEDVLVRGPLTLDQEPIHG